MGKSPYFRTEIPRRQGVARDVCGASGSSEGKDAPTTEGLVKSQAQWDRVQSYVLGLVALVTDLQIISRLT